MPSQLRSLVVLFVLLALAACQSNSADDPSLELPTRFDASEAEATAPAEMAEGTVAEPVIDVTATPLESGGPTLPPSFTPTDQPTPTADLPTATPLPAGSDGTLLFVYNNDSIISINPDGTQQTLIITFGVEQQINDMALSPNGELIAFVAPGSGSAREIWISNLDGTYLQQVTCLGLPSLRKPTWHPDGERIAFFGSQGVGSSEDVYIASWVGSNTCPEGNGQRLLVNADSALMGDLTFNAQGNLLFFSNDTLFVYDLVSEAVTGPLTQTAGLGPDFELGLSPTDPPLLTYIRDTVISQTSVQGGDLVALDITDPANPVVVFEELATNSSYDWRNDGQFVVLSSPESVFILDTQTRIAEALLIGGTMPPIAVFSPDGTRVAFVNGGSADPNVAQLFIAEVQRREPVQITQIEEGMITELLWIPSQ